MRSFRDFMESALYDPERGFYSNRVKTADFYTAPELHRAFGAVLADRLALLLSRVERERPERPLSLIEAGCGDGTLACQIAQRLRVAHPAIASRLRFVLVERGRRDLTDAVRRLTAFGIPVDAVTEIGKLAPFSGVLYSNELLDALPVHLLESREGKILEVFVEESGAEVLKPLSRPELGEAALALQDTLNDGARHAVGLEAASWLKTAAEILQSGFLLSIDYGKRFAPSTPNPPRAFRRHALESELTRDPGAQDLTASVDFEALINAGLRAGLTTESYESLSKFLLDSGLGSWIEAAGGDGAAAYRERARLKTLVHPDGMGEVFKVLVQRKALI
ncbi:MAG: SAM-dependent methyltransferase [Elusimicrobia bacterium]|nr:SAM-dependent methyltransferase [Elusimicrobiota bacterium]